MNKKMVLVWAYKSASLDRLLIKVTSKKSERPICVTYSIDEPLVNYVQSEGRVVYLIRPTQQGDSYFKSDFTHYIYWVLHKILSVYYFRQCLFLFDFFLK
jgi:hypothetical protein